MASRSASRTLTDHDKIRRWAEERSARPTAMRSTEGSGRVGIIRLDFPEYSGEGSLNQISWDDWFRKFDENNLVLVVQDRLSDGRTSTFNKLVSRDLVGEDNGRQTSSRTRSVRSSRSRKTRVQKSNRGASPKSSRSEKSAPREKAKRKSGSTRRGTHGQSAA